MTSRASPGRNKAFGILFGNQEYTDLTIQCDDQEWKVHKAIVCSQSSVLEAAIDNAWQESQSSVITHKEFDAATVELVLSYLYLADYSTECAMLDEPRVDRAKDEESAQTDTVTSNLLAMTVLDAKAEVHSMRAHLVQHVYVYGIADFYDIPDLKQMAAAKFQALLTKNGIVDGIVHVIEAVCAHRVSTDQALRAPLIDTVALKFPQLRQDEAFMDGIATLPVVQDFVLAVLCKVDDIYAAFTDLHETMLLEHKANDKEMQSSLGLQESRADRADELREGTEAALAMLIEHLEEMGNECRNHNCPMEFGRLDIERKGNGAWRIRCGRCRCKMVN